MEPPFNKAAGPKACNFNKNLHMLLLNKFFKNSFFYRTTLVAAFVTFKWRTTRDVLEKCVFPSGGCHAATTGLFVLQGKVFQMQTSWYSSRSKDVIKHVQKYKKTGFYQFTGWQKQSSEWKNPKGVVLSEVFCKQGVLKNFAKFTRKHLHCSLLTELNWTISRIPIWWRHQEFRITFWKYFLPKRIGNNLCSENTNFYGDRVFQVEVFQFSRFHKSQANLTKATLKPGSHQWD